MLPLHSKMARAALDWEIGELAQAAGISLDAVARFERGEALEPSEVESMSDALKPAGISFIEDNETSGAGGPGVRLLKSVSPEVAGPETVQYPEYTQPGASTGAGG